MGIYQERREKRLRTLIETDEPLWRRQIAFCGLDEAGRGPLMGPVMAACVMMPPDPLIVGVDDSKKLTERRREELYEQIIQTALFFRVAQATPREIDELNILRATHLAMQRAAQGVPCGLFLTDAVHGLVLPGEVRNMVRGDQRCYCIAAASILAKVSRDRLVRQLDTQYPQYGFARHKGYPTKAHIEALRRYGPCPEHRRSFIGKFVGAQA